MVMTLPICYKENALILLRFQQDPAPIDAEIGAVHRLKKNARYAQHPGAFDSTHTPDKQIGDTLH